MSRINCEQIIQINLFDKFPLNPNQIPIEQPLQTFRNQCLLVKSKIIDAVITTESATTSGRVIPLSSFFSTDLLVQIVMTRTKQVKNSFRMETLFDYSNVLQNCEYIGSSLERQVRSKGAYVIMYYYKQPQPYITKTVLGSF